MPNNILDDFDQSEDAVHIKEEELLKTIWLQPAATLSYVLKHCPEKYMTLFFILGGIAAAIDRAANKNLGENLSLIAVLSTAIIGGALFGWLTYYLYAWTLSVTGKWLDGTAEPAPFRTLLVWALVPRIAILALLPFQILVFGEDLFRSTLEFDYSISGLLLIFFGILELVLIIWSMVILVAGIRLIQDFSTGRAILNMTAPLLVFIGLILVIALFFRAGE